MQHSHDQLPVRANPDDRQLRRHHTPRYVMYRVRDSFAKRVSKLICAIFLTILLCVSILGFILWLSLRPHRPRFHIHDFSIPGLAQPNGFENAAVIFNVTLRNPNQKIGIYYYAMDVDVYYDDQSIGRTSLLFPFYQQPKNTTLLFGVLSGATLTVNNQRWTQFQTDLTQGEVIFRLEITSTIRFRVATWDSRRHKMHAICPVGIGPGGTILASYKDKRCPVYFT